MGLGSRAGDPHGHAAPAVRGTWYELVMAEAGHPHWGAASRSGSCTSGCTRGGGSEQAASSECWRRPGSEPRRTQGGAGRARLGPGLRGGAGTRSGSGFQGVVAGPGRGAGRALSVRDEHSRMILELERFRTHRTETVRAHFEELFRRHGLPRAIGATTGRLCQRPGAVGTEPALGVVAGPGDPAGGSRPGCPGQQGARADAPGRGRELQAGRIGDSEAAFEQWRQEFNTERPHEALG